MKLAATILLGLLFLGGVVRLILFFRRPAGPWPLPNHKLGRHSLLALGFINILISLLGSVMLLKAYADPFEILLGVPMVAVIGEVAFRKNSIEPFSG